MAGWPHVVISWIDFRRPYDLVAVIIQSVMMMCSFLIVLGLIYVIILVIAIALHHVICDRDPKKIPNYVKQSIQFSSSESEDDEEDIDANDFEAQKKNQTKLKIEALEKFMSYEGTPSSQ